MSSGLPPLFSPLTLAPETAAGPALRPTDSFFLHQFVEAGLLGLAALLGLVAAALRRDQASRPFLLLVLLCGLTLNLGEAFPLGLLLAVSLCHALAPCHG